MAFLKYVCLSDLHLGAEYSLLTKINISNEDGNNTNVSIAKCDHIVFSSEDSPDR